MERDAPITEATVRQLARSQSYDRGENYYEQGAVLNVTKRAETLRAEVEGSQYEPYQVTVELGDSGVANTECSCPYDHGGICKHRVAVLLTYLRDSETVTTHPPVSELLADCDRETLYDVLVDVLDDRPELAAEVEQRLAEEGAPATVESEAESAAVRASLDPETVRSRVRDLLDFSRSSGVSDPRADMERRVDDLSDLVDDAWALVEAGDGDAALDVLEAITEELLGEEWLRLSYDDSGAIFECLDELGAACTEAVLTADLTSEERETWIAQLDTWADELASYTREPPFRAGAIAADRGWDDNQIQRVLGGAEETPRLWEDERPWYADDVAVAYLDVLERDDRTEEYLRFAKAAGQIEQYVTKLIELGRVEEAVEYAVENLSTPDTAFTVAQTLRKRDRPDDAIRVAREGLSCEGPRKTELAAWLREFADSHGGQESAVQAAITAFDADPSLTAYQAAEDVAGDRWPATREELLASLDRRRPERPSSARDHVEVFLYENRLDEAISIADRFEHHSVVEPVVDAAIEDRPRWAIEACKAQAEPIIEEGKSDQYRHAVRWLEKAGEAAREAGKLDDWCEYVETLRDRHSRKYKLAPMLDDLLDDF
ncbi:SWIM zinc finger family protein [Halomicrobium katesii]|uniref:SWIM zinc finger family protein n=1 Tax=Halomicrobium katesii TaxID=437163 RepID=UPI0003742E28|nr:SWIM zinc finger family protein [Halomicrobium katesii]